MAERRVEGTTKAEDGRISEICGKWGRRSQADAIKEIQSGASEYYVEEAGVRTRVTVVEGSEGNRLQTIDDPASDNNLQNLPDC